MSGGVLARRCGRPAQARRPREGPDGGARRSASAPTRGSRSRLTERSLVVPCANAPVDLLLVRPSDIPEYAQDGVVDLGITGANLVAEAEAEVVTLAELGFGRCTLDAAVPVDAPQQSVADLAGLRVATAYPVSTEAAPRASAASSCELVPVSRLGRGGAAARAWPTRSSTSSRPARR